MMKEHAGDILFAANPDGEVHLSYEPFLADQPRIVYILRSFEENRTASAGAFGNCI